MLSVLAWCFAGLLGISGLGYQYTDSNTSCLTEFSGRLFFTGSSTLRFPEYGAPMAYVSNSSLGLYPHAAIATDAKGCASHGRRILERNGSVVDAGIATLLCNGLINMQGMGVGGGFFMVYYKASEKKSYVLDARETAPSKANSEMFKGKDPVTHVLGPLAIAVPGELRGYYEAWKKFGKLPWKALFQESIRMCHEGIPVEHALERTLQIFGDKIPRKTLIWKLLYNETEGRFKRQGDVMIRPELGDFLKRVADDPEGLINGSLLEEIYTDLTDVNSIITMEDLKNYTPIWREPVEMPIRRSADLTPDLRLITCPPPSSGVLVGLGLNMLSHYNYTDDEGNYIASDALFYHRLTETFKFLFAQRSLLPNEISEFAVDDREFLEKLKSLEYADELYSKITDDKTHNLSYYGSVFTSSDSGTSHVSLMSPDGDALSITSTINTVLGSGVIGKRTGILFNNEMDDFSIEDQVNAFGLEPSTRQLIQPGIRPISSMTPLIILDAKTGFPYLVIGGSGGSQIITSTLQTVHSILKLRVNVKSAIDSIRVHHQLLPNFLRHDSHMPKEVLTSLRQLGHNISSKVLASAVQGIQVLDVRCPNSTTKRCLLANADYRKGGDSDGF